MKVAVTGKGGVGKTTLSACLAALFARRGTRVIAVDADPDSNLAATLGFPDPDGITPIVAMDELIAARTGSQNLKDGAYFTLNPEVGDIPELCCPEHEGIRLLVMGGAARRGGSGCFCPENAFLRALMAHLLFTRDDAVILDMEAGVEHLSRGTARGVDALLTVVEPGARSLETAVRIRRLAADLGIGRVWGVGNKVRSAQDEGYIREGAGDLEVLAFLPYAGQVVEAGMGGAGVGALLDGPVGDEVSRIAAVLERECPVARSA